MLERRYILRPTLPTIISTFALTLITLWTGAPILEGVFKWPGLGLHVVARDRSIRNARHRRLDGHLCIPARHHGLPARFHLRTGRPACQSRREGSKMNNLLKYVPRTQTISLPRSSAALMILGADRDCHLHYHHHPLLRSHPLVARRAGCLVSEPGQRPASLVNLFRREKLPASFALPSDETNKTVTQSAEGFNVIEIVYPFEYDFDSFPQELTLFLKRKLH
jgi:hypothetical protein